VTIVEQKQKLRIELKRVLSSIPKIQKQAKSKIILEKLTNTKFFESAKTVLLFASTENEPNTWDFIKHFKKYKKDFYLPVSLSLRAGKINSNLKLGIDSHGIYIPVDTVPIQEIEFFDIILVPGLSFDKQFNRLGHGSGWYDKALKIVKVKRIIGLCFKEQVVEALPTATFDVKIDQLITD
jgi:5-formyltetrahydrofolate cyclo-ligase